MKSLFAANIRVVAVGAAFFAIGLFRLNDLSLYTDSTRYVIWGTSIAHGNGWLDDTQPEPDRYVVNAPLYPVVLAPALAFAPHSILVAKVWTLMLGTLALMLFGVWLGKLLDARSAFAGTLLLAANAMVLVTFTEVLSESTFLALTFTGFLLLESYLVDKKAADFRWLVAVLAVLPLVREVGITLVGAVVAVLLLRRQWKPAAIIFLAAIALSGAWMIRNLVWVGTPISAQSSNVQFVFEHVLTPPSAPLFSELSARIQHNVSALAVQLGGMIFYPLPTTLIVEPSGIFKSIVSALAWLKYAVFFTVVPLLLAGIAADLRHSNAGVVRLLFAAGYAAIVLAYPVHDIRFLVPLIPLMVFYVLFGVRWIPVRPADASQTGGERHVNVPATLRPAVCSAAAAMVVLPNLLYDYEIVRTNVQFQKSPATFVRRLQTSPAARTHFGQNWKLMADWIHTEISESVIVACAAKDIAPFIGHRKVLEINDGVPPPMFDQLLRDNAAGYVLANTLWDGITTYEFQMRESVRFRFEHLHSIADLHLYRVKSRWKEWAYESRPVRQSEGPLSGRRTASDTTSSAGWLRLARQQILEGNYSNAVRHAAESQRRERFLQPALLYQLVVASTLTGDSISAHRTLGQMFTLNRTTPYLWASRLHVQAMTNLAAARKIMNPQIRSQQIYLVGRLMWDLGYRRRSLELLRESLRTDSTNFISLLWQWHYAIQVGDTTRASATLRTLASIDSANAVVRSFREMMRLSSRIKLTTNPLQHSALRMLLAREYQKMELPDEAIDEAERVLREDSSNREAWLLLEQLFRMKKKPLAEAAVHNASVAFVR